MASRVARTAGDRQHVDLGAAIRRPLAGPLDETAENGLQPVVAGVVQMVGLGGREQDLVDARAEKRGEPGIPAVAEGGQHVGERGFEIGHRIRAGIERGQHVDQHDLAVEPGEMIAEERPHHARDIGVVAARHHGVQRARLRLRVGRDVERSEGQHGRAFEIARHQEAPRRQRRQGVSRGAARRADRT